MDKLIKFAGYVVIGFAGSLLGYLLLCLIEPYPVRVFFLMYMSIPGILLGLFWGIVIRKNKTLLFVLCILLGIVASPFIFWFMFPGGY